MSQSKTKGSNWWNVSMKIGFTKFVTCVFAHSSEVAEERAIEEALDLGWLEKNISDVRVAISR